MKPHLLAIVFLSTLTGAFAENPKFPVSDIPENLKKEANVVVREDRTSYKILSRNKGRFNAYLAVTIFNAKGKKFATTVLGYDKLVKITNLKASVYDADGKLIKKLKNSEIYDQSSFDGLYSDNRMKSIDLSQAFYPYTVEVEYEKEYNYLFSIDGSYIIPGENAAVQVASYQLIFPENLKPRYKWHNTTVEPVSGITTDGFQSLTWTFKDLPAFKDEPYAPDYAFIPYVEAAPTAFEYAAYVGEMSSWENFGKWIASLNEGRNQLPEPTIQKIKELTAKANTTEEKVKILYEFLQNKTRYVSIQLGIGGLQPFEASVVDKTGYGDCKALSNYMVSMLNTVGIKSHYALINAGSHADDMDVNFPSSQFNHAIVAVPNGADTIWLECTSQTNPFGYQGTFTGDRKALLIKDEGAAVVNTTRYPTEKNLQCRTAQVALELTGDATATVKTTYEGLQYENDHLNFILDNELEEQKKWIQNSTKIPTFDLISFNFSHQKNKVPVATVKADFFLTKYAAVSGKRIFLVPNLMNRRTTIPEKVDSRKTDVVLRRTFLELDTITYKIPDTIYPEILPDAIRIKTRFGEYEASFTLHEGSLVYTRKLRIEKGRFPPESYTELVDFYKSISKADNTKVVFLTKT
jgi:hypothetical protein